MINALFSSKCGGTKEFILDGTRFGWETIISMYQRECDRASKGLTRMNEGGFCNTRFMDQIKRCTC